MTTTLRAASVQFQHLANDKNYNLTVMENFITRAAADNVQVLAFPEMCITGYWHVRHMTEHQLAALAEPIANSPSLARIKPLAQRYQMAIGVGLVEQGEDGCFYNSYVVCLPDGQTHTHRKLHSFEHPLIASGNDFTVFDTPWGVRMGILICWDNNLVENARITTLLGADILFAPHQTGGTHSRSPHGMKPLPLSLWQQRETNPMAIEEAFRGDSGRGWIMRWLPSRAHDNGIFILFSNGVGIDDDEIRTGNAMILDPYGRIVTETSAAQDQMVTADLDLALIPLCNGRRWIHGRRPELYHLLSQQQGYERDAHTAHFSS
ncbi:acyltransferase [Serratia sp. S1B]|nr:acyltransferase [Serratia sp. S1B]